MLSIYNKIDSNKDLIISSVKNKKFDKSLINFLNSYILKIFNNHFSHFYTFFEKDEIISTGWLILIKNIENLNTDIQTLNIYLYTKIKHGFYNLIYEYKNQTTQYFSYFQSKLLMEISKFFVDYYEKNNKYPDDNTVIEKFKNELDISKDKLNTNNPKYKKYSVIKKEVENILFMKNIEKIDINSDLNDKDNILSEINKKTISHNIDDKIFIKEITTLLYDMSNKYLTKREREVFLSRLPVGLNGEEKEIKTLENIGQELSLSKERVRQIYKKATNKIMPKIKDIIKI